MTVVFDRPYQFVPPHRGTLWPALIQRFRLVDWYLKRKEGVVSHECRDLHHLRDSLDRGDGILLAPNHCRYADPLVLGWPARDLRTNVYAMASWHLFNKGRFDGFAIKKMGGFSIHREASDRQALETAIEILATAERPLVLFPEGTTNRSNDVLKPLLDGVSFIARAAARRREKKLNGQVVMHPVGIKYLCIGDAYPWAHQQLLIMEQRLGWQTPSHLSILQRTERLVSGILALREVQYLGDVGSGTMSQRRGALMDDVLMQIESRLGIDTQGGDIRHRVRGIRSVVSAMLFQSDAVMEPKEKEQLRQDVVAADMVQEMVSCPEAYLTADQVSDTRIIETIQRAQEVLLGIVDCSVPLRVVIQFGEAIKVPAAKAPKDGTDPLMVQLHDRLSGMLKTLSGDARSLADDRLEKW